MSDRTPDITLERINRLTQAVADMGESNTAQGRMLVRMLSQINDQLVGIRTELTELKAAVRELTSEQMLLGNRVENAFSRALRTNIRLDELEDQAGS